MVAPRFDQALWRNRGGWRRPRGCLIRSLLSLSRYAALRLIIHRLPSFAIRHSPFAIRFTAFPSFQPVVLRVVGVGGR